AALQVAKGKHTLGICGRGDDTIRDDDTFQRLGKECNASADLVGNVDPVATLDVDRGKSLRLCSITKIAKGIPAPAFQRANFQEDTCMGGTCAYGHGTGKSTCS